MPTHHPDQFLLSDYAAGSTASAVALPMAVHLEHCGKCREDVQALTGLGAQLFEELEPLSVSDDALSRVFDSLDIDGEEVAPAKSGHRDDFPSVLQGLVPENIEDLHWKRLGRALRVAHLGLGDSEREVSLHHIRAGGRVSEHGHKGNEITVVLRGGFSDADGDYQVGDFIWRTPEHVHRPVAWADTDCLCLSVLDAPIRIKGWLGQFVNPFLGIHPG